MYLTAVLLLKVYWIKCLINTNFYLATNVHSLKKFDKWSHSCELKVTTDQSQTYRQILFISDAESWQAYMTHNKPLQKLKLNKASYTCYTILQSSKSYIKVTQITNLHQTCFQFFENQSIWLLLTVTIGSRSVWQFPDCCFSFCPETDTYLLLKQTTNWHSRESFPSKPVLNIHQSPANLLSRKWFKKFFQMFY